MDFKYDSESVEKDMSTLDELDRKYFVETMKLLAKLGYKVLRANKHIKHMGQGLYQIKTSKQGRILFYIKDGVLIIIIVFIKKTQKTPLRIINAARNRVKQIR